MNWTSVFFQDWQGLVVLFFVGVFAVGTLVLFLRISGETNASQAQCFGLDVACLVLESDGTISASLRPARSKEST